MKTVVIATNNAHKAREIAEALPFPGWEFETLRQMGVESDPVEDAETFLGNARIKARAARDACEGCAVIADDSGLEVDALGGAPGVHSARYAGEPCDDARNNAKLLAELADVPDGKRTARFVCTLVLIDEDGSEVDARGTIEGAIGREARGEHGGRGASRGEERRLAPRQRAACPEGEAGGAPVGRPWLELARFSVLPCCVTMLLR